MSRDLAQLLEDAAFRPDVPDDLPELVARGRRRGTVRRVAVVAGAQALAVAAVVAVAATVLPPITTPEVVDQPTSAPAPSPTAAEATPGPGTDAEPDAASARRIAWLPELNSQRAVFEEQLDQTTDPDQRQRLQAILDAFDALAEQGPKDALAPVDAIDAAYQSLVLAELYRRADAVVGECLEANGLTPLGPHAPKERDIFVSLTVNRVQYPNLELIEAAGIPSEPSPVSQEDQPDDAYRSIAGRCKDSEEYRTAFDVRERAWGIAVQWLDHAEQQIDDTDGLEQFTTCLLDAGVPAEAAQTPTHFLDHAGRAHRAAIEQGDADAGDVVDQGDAQLYAACATPLFQHRVAVRERLRPAYLAARQAELDELAGIIASLDDSPGATSDEP